MIRFERFAIQLLILVLLPLLVRAQVSVRDSSIAMVMIRPSFGIQVPGGDMSVRFGVNQSVGIAVTRKVASGWMFTAEGAFIFGAKINQPGLFSNLTTAEGTIIGSDGLYADIRAFERGYYTTIGVGRMFKSKKPNPNCGFITEFSAGFFQHKIKIQDKKNSVPSLQGDYLKGYDRLTNGLVVREFLGYIYIGNRRLVNFYGGLELVQGFTQNRRTYNYDLMGKEEGKRIDLLFGLRVGWVIPLFKEAPDDFYFY